MLLSRSSEYSIRALLFLAQQPPGKLVMAKRIAEEAGLPSHFLAKLLQQLARKGLLRSNKGPAGGFSLGRPSTEITLLGVVDAIDGVEDLSACPLGADHCTEGNPCSMHDGWLRVRSRIVDYLEHTSLADVSESGPATNKSTGRKAKSIGSR